MTLSELARADRIDRFLSREERDRLLTSAIDYFVSIRDYRGFDERGGWRHGVAHGADLLVQLALNPVFGRTELDRILAALESQVAPPSHFYIYGESDRLANVALAVSQRGIYGQSEWAQWLKRVSMPAPFPDWGAAYSSQRGLARVHDVTAFISRVFIVSHLSTDPADDALRTAAETAMRTMP